MNFKKLFFMLTFVVLFATTAFAQNTIYVDATNGSNAYTGEHETNLPAGTGPKATFAAGVAALANAANGGTIIIRAGTYAEALDLTTGLPAAVTSYTIIVKQLNVNTDAVFTGNVAGEHIQINRAGLTVTINQFGTTERILIKPSAAKSVNMVAGTINLNPSAALTINDLGAGELTLTYKMAGGSFSNAAPAVAGVGATTGILLNYTVASSFIAGQEAAYASFGGIGKITINTGANGRVVTFPGAIAFNAANTLDVIDVTTGGASFPSTVNLGLGDIVNNAGGTVTVTGLVSGAVSTGAGVADADVSSVVNVAGGSILLNGGMTWTAPTGTANKNVGGTTLAVDNQAAGTITLGPVAFVASNTAGTDNYSMTFNNAAAGGTLNVGVVTASSSGSNANYGILTLVNAATANIAGGSYRGALTNNGGTLTVTGATTVLGVFTNAATVALGGNILTLPSAVAHLTNGGTVTATSAGGITVTSTGANSFNGGTLSNVTINGTGGVTTFQTNAVVMTTLNVTLGTATFAIGTTVTTANVNGGTLTVNNGVTLTVTNLYESAGTITLGGGATGVIDVKGDFSRTGGAFTADVGSLMSFTGTVAQSVDGGPLFQLVNLTFTNSVSPITVNNTIRVTGTATISTATTVNFNTINLVLNSATAKIINNGVYNTTANSGGGVILGGGTLVTNGFYGGGQTIEGTGTFSYITVDAGANPNVYPVAVASSGPGTVFGLNPEITSAGHVLATGDVIYYEGGGVPGTAPAGYYAITKTGANTFTIKVAVATTVFEPPTRNYFVIPTSYVINTVTGVKFSGILRLYTGALSVRDAGVDFSPYGTSAKVVRHIWDATGFAAGQPIQSILLADVGTWNNAAVQYDVEYATGTALTAGNNIDVLLGAIEFPNVANRVRDLTVSATSVLTGAVQITAARTFAGNLTVNNGSVLGLTGALTSSAANGTHVVSGDVIQNAAAVGNKLVFAGGGTLTGGTGNSNIVAVDFNTTGTYSVTAMKTLGANAATNAVGVLGGATVNLAMANLGTTANPNWGDVTNLTLTGSRVNLTGDIDVVNRNLDVDGTSTFDFGNYNVWWKSAGSFNAAAATAQFLATGAGATTGGFLQIRATSGLNLNGASIPRLVMDPDAAGTFTLTLGSNSGVYQIFNNLGNDVLEIDAAASAAKTFTLSQNATWNHGGTATYPSNNGDGVFAITGAGTVTANLGANATIPNLTVNSTGSFTLVDNIAGVGVPVLNITDPVAAPGVFTLTSGTINQDAVDISLNDAGAVFAYTAGLFNQSSVVGTSATDAQNGELVFNNNVAQTFANAAGLSIPNLRVAGNAGVTGGANAWTVTKRLVFGTGAGAFGPLGIGATGRMTLADGCWVERRGPGALSHAPAYGGVVDIYFVDGGVAGAGPIAVGLETPAAGTTTLRDLFINMTGAGTDVNSTKNITVNRSLNLMAGNYDFEQVAGTIYTITMAANTDVIVTNGNLINSGSTTVTTLLGGPVTLTYQNTAAGRSTTTREFPATAGFVSTLNVNSASGAGTIGLVLHDNRSVGDFVLNTGAPTVTDVQFDLNAKTLSVTNPLSATLTKGILSSKASLAGVYQYGSLIVTGAFSSTVNTSIQNVNVTTGGAATLGGVFGATDWEGTGAAPNLPGFDPSFTVGADGNFQNLTTNTGSNITDGNFTVWGTSTLNGITNITSFTGYGNVTVNNGFIGGTLTVMKDLTVGSVGGGAFASTTNIVFGFAPTSVDLIPTNAVFTIHQNEAIDNLTINKPDPAHLATDPGRVCYSVTMPEVSADNLYNNGRLLQVGSVGGVLKLYDGIFITNDNVLELPRDVRGFNRTALNYIQSHVVGNVQKMLVAGDGNPAIVGSLARFEFPVGTPLVVENGVTTAHYRPFALQFSQNYPCLVSSEFQVNHINAKDNIIDGFPIDAGINPFTNQQVKSVDTPPYYWLASSSPSLGGSQKFDVELTGTSPFGREFADADNFRVIRRFFGATSNNRWYLQGNAAQYIANNSFYVNNPAPGEKKAEVRVVGAESGNNGAIVPQATVFTIGLPGNKPTLTSPTLANALLLTATENQTSTPATYQATPNTFGGTIKYSIIAGAQSWLTINENTGVLTASLVNNFTAGNAPNNVYDFTVSVVEYQNNVPTGFTTEVPSRITVANTNRVPSFTADGAATKATASVKNGATYSFTYKAIDPDGDALTYSYTVDTAPAGTATIAAALGTLTFNPVFADAGKTFTFTIKATDANAGTATTTTAVTVTYAAAKGDVNGNGTVAADDAAEILKYVVGLITLTPEQLYASDVNNDGTVGALDAAWILYYVANSAWPSAKVSAAMGVIEAGKLQKEADGYLLPINLTNTSGVLSVYSELNIDANIEVLGITARAPQGWLSASRIENGKVTFAMSGLEPLKDGPVAYVKIRIKDIEASATIYGNANLNDGYNSALNSITVREIPTEFTLSQNYPNPFNPTTTIKFAIPENANVRLDVYNMLGQKVRTLMDGMQDAGYYKVNWDGTNDLGGKVSSGIYIYRISAGKYNSTMKMNLLK